jgi:hypothetical protein
MEKLQIPEMGDTKILTALKRPFQLGTLLMPELRSFQSLTGRINRNIAAQAVDIRCRTSAGSGIIVARQDASDTIGLE